MTSKGSSNNFSPGNILSNLRFSRRQVTKRKFNIGSVTLPPGTATVSAETKVSPIAAFVVGSSFKVPQRQSDRKSHQDDRKSHQDLAELSRSSPLALIVEQNENQFPTEEDQSNEEHQTEEGSSGVASEPEDILEPIQKKQRKSLGSEMETPPPGDVSLSFLASTPKPGKTQLSRRRPFTAVREVQQKKRRDESGGVTQSGDESDEKHSPARNSSQPKKQKVSISDSKKIVSVKASRLKQPSNYVTSKGINKNMSRTQTITGKMATRKEKSSEEVISDIGSKKIGQKGGSIKETSSGDLTSSVDRKRNIEKTITEKASETIKIKNAKGFDVATGKTSNKKSERMVGIAKALNGRRKVSVSVNDTEIGNDSERESVKTKNLKRNAANTADGDAINDNSLGDSAKTVKTFSGRRKITVSVNKVQVGSRNIVKDCSDTSKQIGKSQNQPKKLTAKTTTATKASTSRGEITIGDKALNLTLARKRTKSNVNRKLMTLAKKNVDQSPDESLGPDQTMMVWEQEGVKRTRGDLVDLDVLLNTVTEVLESQLDVCEAQKEQQAVRQLEKYLVQDITSMISNVQTVRTLQARIRKSTQSVKLKQTSLMVAQRNRVEMEEKCKPAEEQKEEEENMRRINGCLSDLRLLISRC